MRVRTWLTGLGIGSLVLVGVIAAAPLTGAARQGATPAAQTAAEDDGDDQEHTGTAIVGTPLLRPSIDLIRAQELALAGQAGAAVVAVELDGDDGVLVYDVELNNGVEVEIDATSGAVVKTEPSDDQEDEQGENDENGENGNEDEAEEETGTNPGQPATN